MVELNFWWDNFYCRTYDAHEGFRRGKRLRTFTVNIPEIYIIINISLFSIIFYYIEIYNLLGKHKKKN